MKITVAGNKKEYEDGKAKAEAEIEDHQQPARSEDDGFDGELKTFHG